MRDRFLSHTRQSPSRREVINSELEEHSIRMNNILQNDIALLEQENSLLKIKSGKVNELEDKVDSILKHNTQLLAENEQLAKLLHHQKAEIQLLKDKQGTTHEKEYERKKLSSQVNQLQLMLKEAEIKNKELLDSKAQLQKQLQDNKWKFSSVSQIHDQEIRKLKEEIDKRDYELNDLGNRFKRQASEADLDILRLKQDKDKLRRQLHSIEAQRKADIEAIRQKLEANFAEQIQAIKRSHLHNVQTLELENRKMKEKLEGRNSEVDQISSKFSNQRIHLEETVSILKKENQAMSTKIMQLDRLGENEKQSLKMKLSQMHEAEIEEMRLNHQKYVECLQEEIRKLESNFPRKNQEIEQLLREKLDVRAAFEYENNRLSDENQALRAKFREAQLKLNDNQALYESKLKDKDAHLQYTQKLNAQQLSNFEQRQKVLQKLVEQKEKELNSQKMNFREKEQHYKEQVQEYQDENEKLRLQNKRNNAEKDRIIEDIQNTLGNKTSEMSQVIEALNSKLKTKTNELQTANSTIELRDKENKQLKELVRNLEKRMQKMEKENEHLRSKLIQKDQKTNQMLNEQKARLESSFTYALDNLKADHQSAIKMELNKSKGLADKINLQDKEVHELMKAYEKLRDGMEVLTEQEANKKEMTLKFPGATADVMAIKNLFDVFLKTKVLQVCRGVQPKENLPSK